MLRHILIFIILGIHAQCIFASSSWNSFDQIFLNKKAVQLSKDKKRYEFVCNDIVNSSLNKPAMFIYNKSKKTISYVYMERNTYKINNIKKVNNNFYIDLDDGQLKYKVYKIEDNIYIWQLVDNDGKKVDEPFYIGLYKKDLSELNKQNIKNGCY